MATEILRINLLGVYIRAEIAKLANFFNMVACVSVDYQNV